MGLVINLWRTGTGCRTWEEPNRRTHVYRQDKDLTPRPENNAAHSHAVQQGMDHRRKTGFAK